MGYVDGFVVPVPKKKLQAYLRMARKAGKVWREHGALDYKECVADDVKPGKLTSFPQAVKLKQDETVVFSWIVYRSRAERGFTDVRARCEREPELLRHGAGYVLYALMDAVVDRYFPILDELETEIENIEDRMFANQTARENIEALYDLKRKLMTLKHATEPLLEATGKLFGGRVPQLAVGLHDYFRDVYDHLLRLHQSIDSMRDMVTTAISVAISLISIQETEVTKQLASYGALIAVPTLIAGIYGMNFQHMPEINSPLGYPLSLAAMIGIDIYMFSRFRKAKWI